ncbi:hypothetical protein ACVWXB_007225 [Streptomyces sp. TE12347]
MVAAGRSVVESAIHAPALFTPYATDPAPIDPSV